MRFPVLHDGEPVASDSGEADPLQLALREEHKHLQLLLELVEAARGALDPETALQSVVDGFAETRRQLVESRSLEQLDVSLLHLRSLPETIDLIEHEARRLSDAAEARVELAAEARETLGVDDPRAPWPLTPDSVVLPLRTEQGLVGRLFLSGLDEPPAPSDRELLRRFAEHAAGAIGQALFHTHKERLAALEERQSLARDLHDSVAQSLYGATMYAEAASRRLDAADAEAARDLIVKLRQVCVGALREMRLLLFQMRPPSGGEGLEERIRARLAAVEERAATSAELHVEGLRKLPPELESALLAICTEALNNSLRHADATRVEIRIRQQRERLTLEVVDDGRGFDPEAERDAGGMGLTGMAERAARLGGRLSVCSEPGGGTRIEVEVPISRRAAGSLSLSR